jgi:hypothetical protein
MESTQPAGGTDVPLLVVLVLSVFALLASTAFGPEEVTSPPPVSAATAR